MSEEKTDEELMRDAFIYSGGSRVIHLLCLRLKAANRRIAELENAMQGKTMFCAGCERAARRIAELEASAKEPGE